ncbi:hypothetical protein [Nonomuraea sp. NPDC048826]|uniref:hypothetical protein n=1 Tax=Nonomuraea sp. NPDC048826 TaxID=3364347 RepID=UPI00371671B6
MKFSRRLAVLGVAVATATALTTTSAAAAAGSWSTSHGTATAAGTTTVVRDGLSVTMKVQGQLTNTGSECYSVWVQYVWDLAPGFPAKHVTKCGTGSAPIDITWVRTIAFPTQSMNLRVCRGQENTSDCGPAIRP